MIENISTVDELNLLIKKIADKEKEFINVNGYAKAGKNGPYNCIDTPVRNSAHWISIFAYLYKLYGEKEYKDVIKKLSIYLSNEDNYGSSGAIKCLDDTKMDHINGTIGQGWAIEGLISAYKVLNDTSLLNLAKKIYLSQKYNFKSHLWERIELDGRNIGIDEVFNHQLWFAANASELIDYSLDSRIKIEIEDFVDSLEDLFDTYNDGLIKHSVKQFQKESKDLKYYIRCFTKIFRRFDQRLDNKSFERGYHLFDLYGFSLLKLRFPDASVFKGKKLQKAIMYGMNIKSLNRKINSNSSKHGNAFAYPYNSPAFEFPYVDTILNGGNNCSLYFELFNLQLHLTYDENTYKFSHMTNDGETLTARLYELVNYLNLKM